MKFSAVVAAAGLASTTEAVRLLNSNFNVVAGQPFTLTWGEATGPVTILLKNGPSDDLGTIDTVATGQTGTAFTWSVPNDLVSGLYAFEITDGTDINYSPQFSLDGTGVQTQTTVGYAPVTPVSSSAAASSATSKPVTSLETLSTLTRPATTATPATVSATFPKASNGTASALDVAPTRAPPTSSGSASSSQTSTPISTNAGAQAKSPLALIMVAVAALVYFN